MSNETPDQQPWRADPSPWQGQAPVPMVPGPQEPYPLPPVSPPVKQRTPRWALIFAGVASAVTVLCVGLGVVGALTEDPEPTTNAAVGSSPSGIATTPAAVPTTPAAKLTTAPPPKPKPHVAITERRWLLIAKNPDAYVGQRFIVHGRVTQFDTATGDDAFRADVGGKKRRPSYGFVDYPTNTILSATADRLANVVEDDLFTARVTVVGSYDYDTQIGGSTTVPWLQVDSITITGSVAS